MKRHLSVFMLAARSSLYKIAAVMLIMTALESGVLYYHFLKIRSGEEFYNVAGIGGIFERYHLPLVFGITFLVIYLSLALTGCEFSGSKLRYTIRRLAVREEFLTAWWAVYNMMCLTVLWALQTAIALVFAYFYTRYAPDGYANPQTIFLSFYMDDFLHSLLPLAETSRYIRNIALIIALGVSASVFSFKLRRDGKDYATIALAAITVVFFKSSLSAFGTDMCLILISIAAIANAAVKVWRECRDEV